VEEHFFDNPEHVDRRHKKYAVVIFLPHELDLLIAPLRERYDPIYNKVSSHLTLVFPFESTRSIDDLVETIREVIGQKNPFDIELESIGDFYPRSPFIYWRTKDNRHLHELYIELYLKLGMPIPRKNYIPHVTVAREISDHRVVMVKDKIASYLPHEKFSALAVDLVTPLPDERWVSVRRIPFASPAADLLLF
jgi:2'-5' RNA ligase